MKRKIEISLFKIPGRKGYKEKETHRQTPFFYISVRRKNSHMRAQMQIQYNVFTFSQYSLPEVRRRHEGIFQTKVSLSTFMFS